MGPIFTTFFSAGILGLIAGLAVGCLRISAVLAFAGMYAVLLLAVLATFSAQGEFSDAVLGTLNIGLASIVPAGSCFMVGGWFARRITRGDSHAP